MAQTPKLGGGGLPKSDGVPQWWQGGAIMGQTPNWGGSPMGGFLNGGGGPQIGWGIPYGGGGHNGTDPKMEEGPQ